MINHGEGQIAVEFRPVHMVGTKALHVGDLLHGGFCKSGECVEGHVMFSSVNVEPEAPGVDVRYLNYRCVAAKRL